MCRNSRVIPNDFLSAIEDFYFWSPAEIFHGIASCVVTDPEFGLSAASGHTCTE